MFSRLFFLFGVCALLPLSNPAAAQDTQHAFAHGTVVDSLKAPLTAAQVLVLDSTNKVVASGKTDESGEFILTGLAPHTSYLFSIRKIGFSPGTTQMVTPNAGDTLWLDVMLRPMPPTLNTVNIKAKANANYHVTAADIAKYSAQNALDVVMKYHPLMLGDVYRECRSDTSHLGIPIAPQPLQMPPPPRSGLTPPGGRNARTPPQFTVPVPIQSSTFFDTSLAMHGYPPPPQLANPADTLGKAPPVLYVNGVPHSEVGMKNILMHIPAEDIAEMNYVNCWNTDFPVQMRNALFVVLKPGKEY